MTTEMSTYNSNSKWERVNILYMRMLFLDKLNNHYASLGLVEKSARASFLKTLTHIEYIAACRKAHYH